MNKSPAPTCTVRTAPVGPWYLLNLEARIPDGLQMRKHVEFSFDREFAGLSPRGIPLSVKGTAGPAAIGSLSLLKEKPSDWKAIPHFAEQCLPVVTPKPRLAYFGMRRSGWGDHCTTLCIHPNDLAPIVEIDDERSKPHPNELSITKVTPNVVNLVARFAQRLKLVLFGGSATQLLRKSHSYVRVPITLELNRAEWLALGRHLFTGKSSGTLLDTTRLFEVENRFGLAFRSNPQNYFKLPGQSIDEVKATWGVDVSRPCGYDGKNLLFASLAVLQESKLSRLLPNAIKLKGRRINVVRHVANDPSVCEVAFKEAHTAGIISPANILYVDPTLEHIYVDDKELLVDDFKAPVVARTRLYEGYYADPVAVCPQKLIKQFLVPCRQAVRKYVIPRSVDNFRVLTQSLREASEADPPGRYYRLADLQNLAERDLHQERAERLARKQRLVERYGDLLPDGYEALTDEEIGRYFQVQDLVQVGEIIEAEHHPLLPGGYRVRVMVEWLQKQAPDLVLTCPVKKRTYIRTLDRFEDLIHIPGFWAAVEQTFESAGPWLRKLITCAQAQQAALISAI